MSIEKLIKVIKDGNSCVDSALTTVMESLEHLVLELQELILDQERELEELNESNKALQALSKSIAEQLGEAKNELLEMTNG